jgi:hypothetical protein
MSIILRGSGDAIVKVNGSQLQSLRLSDSDQKVELRRAVEGDYFGIDVTPISDQQSATVYGYFEGINPGSGYYRMPLNLLFTIDEITGSSPRKSGGFYNFSSAGMDVALMKPGAQQKKMMLKGTVPFTFVDPDEFSAMDCPAAPFQTRTDSVSAFSTDQPCYAKGSKPGNYNTDCLRAQILAVGCTNAGELYKNPGTLNKANGLNQSIDQIYNTLVGIQAKDGASSDETKQCSGRIINSPCDPYLLKPDLLFSSDKNLAKKCLSYLYNNKGIDEPGPVQKIGKTYSGVVTYANNTKEVKNIYCLPEGKLNPDAAVLDGLNTLISIGDNGFNNLKGIDAVKAYLNSQLEAAVDMTRNANTDDDRKNAIINCFGTKLNALSQGPVSAPKVISNPCGVIAQYIVIRPSKRVGNPYIQISQLVVVDKDGNNAAKGAQASGSGTWSYESNAANAIDGGAYPRSYPNIFHSQTADDNAYFKINLMKEVDITKIIYYNRADCCSERAYGMRVQFYDKDMTYIFEKEISGYGQVQEIALLNPGVPGTCKAVLNPPPKPTVPPGYRNGVFTRFYKIDNPYPQADPNAWKRDDSIPSGSFSTINIHDEYNGGDFLRAGDMFAVWVRGYYMAMGPETIQFKTTSDDGIYVQFNNQSVISHWDLHGPWEDWSPVINIPKAGLYPIDLRFYEWGGGAICKLEYKSSRVPNYTTDLSTDFVFNQNEEDTTEQTYQNAVKAAQAAAAAAAAITYVDKGCWNDRWDRGLASGGGYGYNVESCFNLAKANGSDKFSLQDGSQCFISNGSDNYKKWGPQSWCPPTGAGWNNHVFQIKKKAIMNGPWVGRDVPIAQIDVDNEGNTVYMIEDDVYTKMVNSKGAARHYTGKMTQYNSANWNSYNVTPTGYYKVTLL